MAIVLGALLGAGCLGVIRGLRPARPTLESIAESLDRWPEPALADPAQVARLSGRFGPAQGAAVADWAGRSVFTRERWRSLSPDFAITGVSPDQLGSKMLVLGGAGLLVPLLLWLMVRSAGVMLVSAELALIAAIVGFPLGVVAPVIDMVSQARQRRHHVRVVVSSFVDLVVLNLAGGMGIESALFAAAEVSSDWAAKRILRSLVRARESGQSSWAAFRQLGSEIGVPELIELAATLQLAGTEGSRIRQSLSARAASLRRHEQADAESAANTTTERLFLPGALLLIGFLLFLGYPAFTRIVGGF